MGRKTALEQTGISQPLHTCGECVGRAAPAELVHVAEEARVGPERCELLEQQRELAFVSQYSCWEVLDDAVFIQEPRRADGADTRNAWIAVGGVADERKKVGKQRSAPTLGGFAVVDGDNLTHDERREIFST